jgi:hypothetical protein
MKAKLRQSIKGSKRKLPKKGVKKRIYPVTYDNEVLSALVLIWEAFNCQCGKLLAPFMQLNIGSIAKEPKFNFSQKITTKLRKISASIIDRLLKPIKARMKIKGTSGTKPASGHLKKLVPMLSHFECIEQGDGLWQIDLVQHDGGNPSGECGLQSDAIL